MKHFLQENDFSAEEIKEIFTHAFAYKASRAQRPTNDLAGQTWGMLFHKKSTRTRVSFEVGIRELGGNPLILDHVYTDRPRGKYRRYRQSTVPLSGWFNHPYAWS